MAAGFPVKANYATGDILTATNMNDLAGTLNLLTSETLSVSAGKNSVINGGMDIWQRGTSVSVAASTAVTSGYTADRWTLPTNANQACTVSRQATGDTSNLPNIQYCARVQRNSGQTGTGVLYFGNTYETVNSIPFAGKNVTVSFYARAGANFSPTSNALGVSVQSGTGTDQNFFGYTGGAAVVSQTATLTTTWQRFTYTGAVASTATELNVKFSWTPTGTAGTNDYFEVTGVQLELGSTATSFSRAGGTIQGELAACQRYFYNGGNTIGSMNTSGNALFIHNLPVPMRTTPSMAFTGTATVSSPGVATYTTTTQPSSISQTQASNAQIYFAMTGMGVTVASGVAYSQTLITLSAEL